MVFMCSYIKTTAQGDKKISYWEFNKSKSGSNVLVCTCALPQNDGQKL